MKHSEKSTKYEHFNAVYAGSYAAVLRWIRGRVPADLAEELTQQTFMQYWQWLLAAAAFPKSDKSLLLSIAHSRGQGRFDGWARLVDDGDFEIDALKAQGIE